MNAFQLLTAQVWVERLGWTLVHFLWQGALIAIAYAAARGWWVPSRNSHARYLLGCAALVAMIAAPVVTYGLLGVSESAPKNPYVGTIPLTSTTAGVHDVTSASLPSLSLPSLSLPSIAARVWSDDVMPWLVVAWLTGAIVFWLRLLGGWAVAARMRSMLVRSAPAEWQGMLDEVRARLQVSRPVRLLVSALVQAPTVVGWLRPVVLVPVGALAGLPPDHIEALLAHELAHIRRHDYLVNILQSVAEALLFYHPAVWWISGHMRSERELCCDDAAVTISGDALSYARVLADLEACRPDRFSPVLAANGGSLAERIGRLIGQPSRVARPLPGPGAAVATVLIVVAACGLLGQAPAARPSFEAVSIKPNQLGGGHSHEESTPERLIASMTTKVLIEQAFGIKPFQVTGGPSWLDESNYDFVAVADSSVKLTNKVLEQCLQSLLADRFQLKYHRETKELPVYSLVVAKNGPKLTPHTGAAGTGTNSNGEHGKETMTGSKLSMAGFASFLAQRMDRPVIDNTGLKGEFDVKMEWSYDQADAPTGPSIFTALQEQLGLRLTSTKGPVEILVVDSVEKPSEN